MNADARRERIEIAGEMAGGVAHDFNHTLGIVKNYIVLLSSDLNDESRNDPQVKEDIRCILAAVEQGEELAKALTLLSRVRDPAPVVFNLNTVIENTAVLLESFTGIKLEYDLDPSLWSMKADQGQIERVILNLALNGRDAMPDGGTLYIRTFNESDPLPHESQLETNYDEIVFFACVSVTDSGVGIPQENLDKIFEPFFTTKEASSGLGLATVYGIVKNAGGYIEVGSEDGKTTFTVRFPAGGGDLAPTPVGHRIGRL